MLRGLSDAAADRFAAAEHLSPGSVQQASLGVGDEARFAGSSPCRQRGRCRAFLSRPPATFRVGAGEPVTSVPVFSGIPDGTKLQPAEEAASQTCPREASEASFVADTARSRRDRSVQKDAQLPRSGLLQHRTAL